MLRCLAILFCASVLTSSVRAEEPRPILLCSTTQVADFARQVVGDDWEVRCVLTPGQDPHLYRVTPNDVRLVEAATLCLENGLHLEGNDWMASLAKDAGKPIVRCTEGIQPLQMAIDDDASVELVHDPHAWFTPKNAAVYVRNILRAVTKLDPANAKTFAARTELYLGELRVLDAWISKQCNAIPRSRRILITSHDAFGYFCQQYGFQSAAPAGWSTGQEIGAGVTPARRKAAVDSIRDFGVKAIFVETSVNPKLIREIASEAGVQIGGELYSDSMGQTDTAGENYIGMMRENVLTIVQALR
ncbi:MAG: zinc ABC transporter substrate-binding protein [Pirellulaceae bacterium]|nr:zinc ABC transporter substrate-binding protein [Pirellulaceae bacterium]